MRLTPLMILALASAAASAHAAEDRYGPARARPMQVASAGGGAYQGRLLSWSSRGFTPQVPDAPAAAAPPAAPIPEPAPIARPAARIEQQPSPQRLPVQASMQPAAPSPAPRRVAAAAPAPSALPDSLYSAPPPPPAPQRMAQAALPATAPTEGSHVRLYSVHRQYGMSPDAIPAPPANASNYVLIGVPSDDEKAAQAEDKPF